MARAERRRDARAKPAAGQSRRYQSAYVGTEGLFFQRLRVHAKWMFVLLAAIFAVGFVVFGVGASGNGVADLFQGGGGSGAPSVSKARDRVQEHPDDPAAYRALATALQTDGQTEAAIEPLVQYSKRRPRDEDALRELAGLYLAKATRLRDEAAVAQSEALDLAPGTGFGPPAESPLGKALANQPVSNAVTQEVNTKFNEAYTAMQSAYGDAKAVYIRLAAVSPDDASVQLYLADAAQNAGDTPTAILAYRRFLQLAPDDPSAPTVKQALAQLVQQSSGATTGAG